MVAAIGYTAAEEAKAMEVKMRQGLWRTLGFVLVGGLVLVGLATADVIDLSHLDTDDAAVPDAGNTAALAVDSTGSNASRTDPVVEVRVQELEHLIGVRDRQIEDLKQALEDVTSEFSARVAEMRARRGAEEGGEVAGLRAALEQTEADLSQAREEHAFLQEHTSAQDRALQEAQAENALLQERTSAQERALQKAQAENASLQEQKSVQERALQEAQAQIASLQEQKSAQERALQAAREEALEEQEATHQAAYKALEAAFAAFRDEVAREREEAAALKSKVARLEAALLEEQTANERERFLLAYNSGSIFLAAGHYDRAERAFLKALAVRENDAPLHYNLGVLYGDHLGQRAKARRHYERFLALAPNDRDAPLVMQWLRELQ